MMHRMEFCFSNVDVYQSRSHILRNVSGRTMPGELLAIMGPSGAGKTTLLNTLAGRVPYTGEITYGGTEINKSLKRMICYVLQHDIFFGNLTLGETLEFAAMVRLPDTMTREEKLARMSLVCTDLDLTHCMDTVMGDMFTPGLSGGQRKRASIACELLRDPDLIFLDEPTTGLDSSTASSLICLLKLYAAKAGKTIVASIHQPSSTNFFQFDKLLMLTGGQVAFYGETDKVVDHFKSVGIEMDPNLNPADFILDVLADNEEIKKKLLEAASGEISTSQRGRSLTKSVVMEGLNSHKSLWNRLAAKFRRKPMLSATAQHINNVTKLEDLDAGSVSMNLLDLDTRDYDCDGNVGHQNWPTGFVTQYSELTRRTWRESRQRILDVPKLLENLLICGLVSLIFFQLPRDEATLRDRMGAVFFIAAHWGFIPLFDAVASFPLERVVINKERRAGWYRLSAYYLAKMTAELVLILIQPTVFVSIVYGAIHLNGWPAFFPTLATVLLVSVVGQSIGLFVGIACLQINQAMTISITLQMTIMLLGGLFTRHIPFWLDWAKYLSFLHYAFHSLMVLEFEDAQSLSCLSTSNSSVFAACKEANSTTIASREVLRYYAVTWHYWQYVLPLLAFTVIFRLLGYLLLRFVRKPV